MYNLIEHLDDDEMQKTIVLGSADENYITLDVAYADGLYSCAAMVFDDTDTCIDCFHPTLAYKTPRIPYMLSHVIRAELECRGIPCDEGLCTSIFDEDFNTQEGGVPYICGSHAHYDSICESLGFNGETLH